MLLHQDAMQLNAVIAVCALWGAACALWAGLLYHLVLRAARVYDASVWFSCPQSFEKLKDDDVVSALHRGAAYAQALEQIVADVEAERRVLASCHDTHVVAYKGIVYRPGTRIPKYVLMELADSHLRGFLEKQAQGSGALRSVPIATVLRLARHMLRGLMYLHTGFKEPIVHRDLKMENVLVFIVDGLPTLKIADVGLARFSSRLAVTRVGGTPFYMAPEVASCWYKGGDPAAIGPASDMYSFGLLFLEAFYTYCLPPSAARCKLTTAVIPAVIPVVAELLTASAPAFAEGLLQCLRSTPSERPTAAALLDRMPAEGSPIVEPRVDAGGAGGVAVSRGVGLPVWMVVFSLMCGPHAVGVAACGSVARACMQPPAPPQRWCTPRPGLNYASRCVNAACVSRGGDVCVPLGFGSEVQWSSTRFGVNCPAVSAAS